MSNELECKSVETKVCPRCSTNLPLSEFGVSRARKDGRNIYCKRCNRDRTNASRQVARDRRLRQNDVRHSIFASSEIQADGTTVTVPPKTVGGRNVLGRAMNSLSAVDRVREAIRRGPKTQRELLEDTRLSRDEIGDALADLLLWTHEVGTRMVGDTRLYFLRQERDFPVAENTDADCAVDPVFDGNGTSSFSSISFLMPGRDPSRQQQKNSAWTAV